LQFESSSFYLENESNKICKNTISRFNLTKKHIEGFGFILLQS